MRVERGTNRCGSRLANGLVVAEHEEGYEQDSQ